MPCRAQPSRALRLAVSASADSKFDGYKPTVAAFFPGQGAQTVGMAKDLCAEVPKAKELFDKASEILGYDLLKVRGQLSMRGPCGPPMVAEEKSHAPIGSSTHAHT